MPFPKKFKPMKGEPIENIADLEKLCYPTLASRKLDGIRAVSLDGKLYSYNLKLIPNVQVQKTFMGLPDGLDGELIHPSGNFQLTTSQAMSSDMAHDLDFMVFDFWNSEETFLRRNRLTLPPLPVWCAGRVKRMHSETVNDAKEALAFYMQCLDLGCEGAMFRHPHRQYKFGRGTVNPKGQELVKLKPVADDEALVLRFEPAMKNNNPAETDNHGHAKRSSSKEGKTPKEEVGKIVALVVTGPYAGLEIPVGPGALKASEKLSLWAWAKDSNVGRRFTFEYQQTGSKDSPRFPRFKRWRDD